MLLWLVLGLTIGIAASRASSHGARRFPTELALGLVASIVGGLLAILLG
jgi:hypothetical protein